MPEPDSDRRRHLPRRPSTVVAVVGLVISIVWPSSLIGAVWIVANDRAAVIGDVAQLKRETADHELRLRKLEDAAADIRLVKSSVERLEKYLVPPTVPRP